jgi:hypothetical protein
MGVQVLLRGRVFRFRITEDLQEKDYRFELQGVVFVSLKWPILCCFSETAIKTDREMA